MKNATIAFLAHFLITGCGTSVSFKSADTFKGGYLEQSVYGTLNVPSGKGNFPVVLLVHTAAGIKSHISEDWPGYFNSIGYATLTIDTAGARGWKRCDWHRFQQMQDAYGALDRLASVPNIDVSRAAVMEFSAGGMAIGENYRKSHKSPAGRQFRAAISVYPDCTSIAWEAKSPLYPLAIIVSKKDASMNCDCLGRREANIEIHVIDDAYHGFDMSHLFGSFRDRYGNILEYNPGATDEAQRIAKAYLDKHLGR